MRMPMSSVQHHTGLCSNCTWVCPYSFSTGWPSASTHAGFPRSSLAPPSFSQRPLFGTDISHLHHRHCPPPCVGFQVQKSAIEARESRILGKQAWFESMLDYLPVAKCFSMSSRPFPAVKSSETLRHIRLRAQEETKQSSLEIQKQISKENRTPKNSLRHWAWAKSIRYSLLQQLPLSDEHPPWPGQSPHKGHPSQDPITVSSSCLK